MRSILIVEDHALLRDLMTVNARDLFGPAAAIYEAGSIAQARQQISRVGRFDLVLLDLRLPDAARLEGLRALKPVLPDAAIVLVSGEYRPADVPGAIEAGAAGMIEKDMAFDAFRAAIGRLLGRRSLPGSEPASPGAPLVERGPRYSFLSPVENAVLAQQAAGRRGATAIARATGLPLETVKTAQRRVREKLAAASD